MIDTNYISVLFAFNLYKTLKMTFLYIKQNDGSSFYCLSSDRESSESVMKNMVSSESLSPSE